MTDRRSTKGPRRPPRAVRVRKAADAAADASPGEAVRLQKALADAGLGSRREIEGWIAEGRVRVNGVPAKLGDRVTGADRIRIDGRDIERRGVRRAPVRVIAYNKSEGELVTRHDPEGRPTVFARLPRLKVGRWIAVGRLDVNTSGLLLFTNEGELASRLMHPSHEVEREYAVRVLGEVPPPALQGLTAGVELEDGPARFERIAEAGGEGANRWYHVVLKEGRNREVRRLWEAVGCTVSRLIRIRYGNVALGPRVFAGHWRDLTAEEVAGLFALAGMPAPDPRRSAARTRRSATPTPAEGGERGSSPPARPKPVADREREPRAARGRRLDDPAGERRTSADRRPPRPRRG